MTDADPYTLLVAAAGGDLSSQRALALQAMAIAGDLESGRDAYTALVEGLVFARMAASHGEVSDQGVFLQLAALMSSMSEDQSACLDTVAEAIARVAIAADAGDENAAHMLPELVAEVSPEVMTAALEIAARIEGKTECLG